MTTQHSLFQSLEPDGPSEGANTAKTDVPNVDASIEVKAPINQPDSYALTRQLRFDAALMAFVLVPDLGRKGIEAISRAYNGDLAAAWRQESNPLASILAQARVPLAHDIADEIVGNRDFYIVQGQMEVAKQISQGISILSRSDFPDELLQLNDAPHWLFVQGNVKALFERPAFAVVGTREPTDYGVRATSAVVQVLSAYPVTIISGLADGIDAVAHRTALQANLPNIAFLGHGINFVFPSSTAELRAQIVASGGAVVTEYLPYEHYQKRYFVQRNRLQAALAEVVIPVQANLKSGTAHTVDFAQKYKKDIIGIQWNGSNGLIERLQADNRVIINILHQDGRKQLDRIVQQKVTEAGKTPSPLRLVEVVLEREIKQRNLGNDDRKKLIEFIKSLDIQDSLCQTELKL